MQTLVDALRRLGLSHALVAVFAAVLAAGVTIVVDQPGPGPNPHHRVTVTLGGPGHKQIALPPAAQAIEHDAAIDDAHDVPGGTESDLHETPTLAPTPAEISRSQALTPPGQPAIPHNLPAATATLPGCTTALVRNYSSRHGAPVLVGVIHWTGSRSIPNSTADGLAIVRWFDQPAAQASSSEITDDDGHCWLVVPEALKPWTQAAYNSWSVSDEHINPGAGPLFTAPAGRQVVLRLMRGWHHRWHLPYRRAIVTQNGCRVIRSGYTDHKSLGACGGGHPDVGSFDIDALIREAASSDTTTPAAAVTETTWCRKLNWWRHAGRPHGGKPEANAVRRRQLLSRHGWACTTRGLVRAET